MLWIESEHKEKDVIYFQEDVWEPTTKKEKESEEVILR